MCLRVCVFSCLLIHICTTGGCPSGWHAHAATDRNIINTQHPIWGVLTRMCVSSHAVKLNKVTAVKQITRLCLSVCALNVQTLYRLYNRWREKRDASAYTRTQTHTHSHTCVKHSERNNQVSLSKHSHTMLQWDLISLCVCVSTCICVCACRRREGFDAFT